MQNDTANSTMIIITLDYNKIYFELWNNVFAHVF